MMLVAALPPILVLALGFIAAAQTRDLRDRSGSGLFALLFAMLMLGLQAGLWVRFGYWLAEIV